MVEFALILPTFLMLVAIAADFGRLFYAYVAITNATKEGAAYGARNPVCDTNANGALCPDPQNVTWRVVNEASNISGITLARVECDAPDGTVRSPLSTCADGDTYIVGASYNFKLITPILSSILGNGLTLSSQAESTVLNLAFDPTPGAAISKKACFGVGCTPVTTPTTDINNNPVYVEGTSGTPITYQVSVTNIGGQTLTGTDIADTNLNIHNKFGSTGCPALPSTLAIAQIWTCTYTMTAPDTQGQPTLDYPNTATFTANEIQQRQSTATVRIDAAPGNLTVSKYESTYKLGGNGAGPFGTTTDLAVGTKSGVTTTVWYQVTVSNPGTLTVGGITVQDSYGAFPVTADCPTPPTSLAPAASWTCVYSRTESTVGDFTNTVTANASAMSPPGPRTASATIHVQSCGTDNLVPNLIGLSKADAQTAWVNAGYASGNLTEWSGHNSDPVVTQNVQAFTCAPSTTTMTVTR